MKKVIAFCCACTAPLTPSAATAAHASKVNRVALIGSPPVLVPVPLSTAERSGIFLVGDIFHPVNVLAVERLLHCDVNHACIRPGAMPVLLARRNPHRIARLDFADRPALGLYASDTGNHMQCLPEGMRVPSGTRARLEAHAAGANARRRRGFDDRVLPRHTGERFLRLPPCRYRATRFYLHRSPPHS